MVLQSGFTQLEFQIQIHIQIQIQRLQSDIFKKSVTFKSHSISVLQIACLFVGEEGRKKGKGAVQKKEGTILAAKKSFGGV